MQDTLTEWLLQSEIPTIRLKTRTELLGDSVDEVAKEQNAIMCEGPVPIILARQLENGAWAGDASYYTPKYQSTHWTMTLLIELGIDGQDTRFRRGVEYMLGATEEDVGTRLASNHLGFSCLWGNLLRYALHAGYAEDTLVKRLINYATQDLHYGTCRCEYNDSRACAWGIVRLLWGLAAIPAKQRTPAIQQAIELGIAFLLQSHRLLEANYPTPDDGKIHSLWSKLSFPLFYQADILFTLRVLAELDALNHPDVQPALAWLAQRQQQNGRWRGSSPYRQRTWREMGDREETNRWISLHAATILHHAQAKY